MSARLVFLSGWSYDAEALAPLAAELGRVGLKMEGMNSMEILDTADPTGALAGAVARRAEPVLIGGWSLGAMLALAAAARAPASCAGLVLIGATARFCAGPDQRHGVPEAEVRALGRALRSDVESALAGFDARCADPHPPLARTIPRDADRLRAGLDYLRRADLRADAARWVGPALLLHGEKDRVVPPDAARALAALMPQARLEIVPEIGHDLPRRAPREVASQVAAWLDAAQTKSVEPRMDLARRRRNQSRATEVTHRARMSDETEGFAQPDENTSNSRTDEPRYGEKRS